MQSFFRGSLPYGDIVSPPRHSHKLDERSMIGVAIALRNSGGAFRDQHTKDGTHGPLKASN
jgi:hypothetical protein